MDNIVEFITIELSPHQAELIAWCNLHYKQLIDIKRSGYLDKGGINFTVHLKSKPLDGLADVEKIDLHDTYDPNKT